MWYVVCGMWYVATCVVWYVVCGMWYVVCGMWYVVHGTWYVPWYVAMAVILNYPAATVSASMDISLKITACNFVLVAINAFYFLTLTFAPASS